MGTTSSKDRDSEEYRLRKERKKKKKEEKERQKEAEKEKRKEKRRSKRKDEDLKAMALAHQHHSLDDEEPSNPFEEPLDHIREEERPLHALSKVTHFDVPTLRKLQVIFTEISQSRVNDGMIDPEELTDAMGLARTCLLARTLFRLFDITQTAKINFRTWASTLSALSPAASLDEKIRWSFQLYDLNQDGSVDVDELRELLVAAVKENVLNLSEKEVESICDATLASVDRDGNGTVEYEEYEALVRDSDFFKEAFTLDVNKMCASFRFRSARSADGAASRLSLQDSEERLKNFQNRQITRHDSEEDDPNKKRFPQPINAATLQREIAKNSPELLRQHSHVSLNRGTATNETVNTTGHPEFIEEVVKPITSLSDLNKELDDL